MEELDRLENSYRSGDSLALFVAIDYCAWHDAPIPAWARDAFRSGLNRYIDGEARELGDAFNIQRPKGWHKSSDYVANFDQWLQLFHEVNKLRADGKATDLGLFEAVGKEFFMSASKARKIFYSQMNSFLFFFLLDDLSQKLFPESLSEENFFEAVCARANYHLVRTAKNSGVKNPKLDLVSPSYIKSNLGQLFSLYSSPSLLTEFLEKNRIT